MKIVLKILFLMLAINIINCQSMNKNIVKAEKFKIIKIEGLISVRGNEPFTYLSLLTDYNKEYSITGKLKDEIRNKYQNKKIKILAKIKTKISLPGFPQEIEVIKIIN